MITNSLKLAATVSKWIQPNLKHIAASYIGSNPSMRMMLSFVDFISPNTVTNAIHGLVARVPDAMIPDVAHSMVDDAIKNGGFVVGNVIFDAADLQELKQLLEYNLPVEKTEKYEVLTSPPAPKEPEPKTAEGVSSGKV